MKFAKRRSRRGIAGIVATVIMFAILFTVGTSYFIFVNAENASYVAALQKATSKQQGSLQESLTVNTLLENDGDVGFTATDTSGVTVNMTAVLVISSTGALLECAGIGFPHGAGCTNTTPALWITIDAGATSASIDTGYLYVAGTTDTVKVLTARGNSYTQTYPEAASQSGSSQSVTVALDNLKWVQLLPQASSLSQKTFVSDCTTAICTASFGKNVAAGDILVDGASWVNEPAPTVTDSISGDQVIAGPQSSVSASASPAEVEDGYTSNCNAATCGLAFSTETPGDTLVYAVGWTNSPSGPTGPTSVQDTRGATWHSGESSSTVVSPTVSLVQYKYSATGCSSSTCALAFTNPPTTGNTLVFGLGWPSTQNYQYVPLTITNCQLVTSAPAIDGSNYNDGASSSLSATLTTTHTNDVIIAIVYGQNTATGTYRTATMSDTAGLTWTGTGSYEEIPNSNGNSFFGQIYYAIASSTLSSDSIKVQWSSAPSLWGFIQVFGVSGASTSSPFDTHSGLPNFPGAGNYASVSTSNALDLVFGLENTSQTSAPTTGTGWSALTSGVAASYTSSEYQVVSATQSGLSLTYSNAASDTDEAWGDAIVGSGTTACGSGTPAIDGYTGAGTETNTASASLTTINANDLIVLFAGTSSSSTSVSSVTDTGGHGWVHRVTESAGSPDSEEEEWYTTATTALSGDSITVKWSATGDNVFTAFGVSGANLATPFDTNSGLPDVATNTNTSPSVSVSTSYAKDLIVGMLSNEHTSSSNCHTESYGTGFTEFLAESADGSNTCQNSDEEYETVSSTQTNLAIPFTTSSGGSNQWSEIGDAIEGSPGAATPNPFQEMVTWDPATYTTYEASNLGNVRFCSDSACNSPLYAWLESCSSTCSTSGSTSTSATAWVKLTSAISSGSTLTIYLVFEGTTVNFDDNYWGEAPQLSGTYGQYDNGANVFNFYDNFAGSTLSATKWQTVIYGGGTISVNNGLTISATSTSYNPILVSKNTYSPGVLDSDMALSSEQTASSTPTIFYATVLPTTTGGDYGFQTGYRYDWAQASTLFRNIVDSGGTYATGKTVAYTLPSTYNIWSGTWGATGSEAFSFNYVSQYSWADTHITYGSAYVGAAGVQGGTVNAYWIRLRAVPPNSIMPSTAFGTLTSGTGSPTSVHDSLGDTFTQGIAQSVTVGSTSYESAIWYATANNPGSSSDTITATFTATVAGDISIYEISGYQTSNVISGYGSSSAGSTTASLSTQSITPNSNSFVVGNAETGSATGNITPGSGSGFSLPGSSGVCNSVQGCGEYQSGLGTLTTVPFALSGSTPWVDVALSFTPQPSTTYYTIMYYATAVSGSGSDTISATFGQTVAGSVSIYEFSGLNASPTTLQASTGGSTSSQGTVQLNTAISLSTAGSVVVAEAESGSTTYTAGSGFALSPAGTGGNCNSVAGCGEYETGASGSNTAQMTISPSEPFTESAIAFPPVVTTYYTEMWYTVAGYSQADTFTTTFQSAGTASISIYDTTGYTTTGFLTATGYSTSGSTSASVTTPFTPATDSFIVGNAVTSVTDTYAATTGFTTSGTCSSAVQGCGEYDAGGGGSANTVPFTLGTSEPWAEVAMSFSTPFNPQSGIQVGGYPTMGVPSGALLVWEVTFTNVDPLHRAITIWPQTEMAIGSAEYDGFDTDYTQAHYYLINSLNPGSTTVNPYSTSGFFTLQYDVPTTLYFAATAALGSTTQAFGTNVLQPFEAYFALTGVMSDGTLFGETIPYPYGIITVANAYTSPTAGAPGPGDTVTVSCTSPCYFGSGVNALVGWINSAGQMTQLTTFTTTTGSCANPNYTQQNGEPQNIPCGGVPSGVTFTVPSSATPGYYTVEVTDYINSVFMTFQVT